MPKEYRFCFDILELAGLDETQSYAKGYNTGLTMDYRREKTIERARNEVVTIGLMAYERWEKSGDYKFVLLHEYIRGLNHGLEQRAQRISNKRLAKSKGPKNS